jgi:EAL domain-containing protein (putative c-di-GMP-specific phosphodiesterase class I)
MDGLSIAAGVIAVWQLTHEVIQYLSDVEDAPEEQILLDKGADIAQGELYDNALQAAVDGDHHKVVQILMNKGADVAQGGLYDNTLQAASDGATISWCRCC